MQGSAVVPALGDWILLVAAWWRTNLTLRQIQLAPLFGVFEVGR